MRLKCIVEYDGTNYSGFQRQIGVKTIQEELENVVSKINKEQTIIYASGRTDAHVHAKGQVFHFDSKLNISPDKWMLGFKSLLPSDITIKDVCEVDENFHARYDVKSKEYRYFINVGKYDSFIINYSLFMYNLNIKEMKKGIKYFIGTHDFISFTQQIDPNKKTIKTIFKADIKKNKDMLEIRFIGTGFLKYQVRIMVGTLLDIGLGRKKASDIKSILQSKNRKNAGKTAPAQGLFLYKVNY